ncbi:hypothetical protein D9758_006993 [Tetrapyrgos nigripes]|uniref:Uncharacterized protein n=1 Tax=Tetrapyrgos nigripes TaxID=182062 RepID=A0A8H5LUB0_9AGAR|nr:hypothetical protein D9758_006993 [Tetrapyrgos nigripes]
MAGYNLTGLRGTTWRKLGDHHSILLLANGSRRTVGVLARPARIFAATRPSVFYWARHHTSAYASAPTSTSIPNFTTASIPLSPCATKMVSAQLGSAFSHTITKRGRLTLSLRYFILQSPHLQTRADVLVVLLICAPILRELFRLAQNSHRRLRSLLPSQRLKSWRRFGRRSRGRRLERTNDVEEILEGYEFDLDVLVLRWCYQCQGCHLPPTTLSVPMLKEMGRVTKTMSPENLILPLQSAPAFTDPFFSPLHPTTWAQNDAGQAVAFANTNADRSIVVPPSFYPLGRRPSNPMVFVDSGACSSLSQDQSTGCPTLLLSRIPSWSGPGRNWEVVGIEDRCLVNSSCCPRLPPPHVLSSRSTPAGPFSEVVLATPVAPATSWTVEPGRARAGFDEVQGTRSSAVGRFSHSEEGPVSSSTQSFDVDVDVDGMERADGDGIMSISATNRHDLAFTIGGGGSPGVTVTVSAMRAPGLALLFVLEAEADLKKIMEEDEE